MANAYSPYMDALEDQPFGAARDTTTARIVSSTEARRSKPLAPHPLII